MTRYDFHLTSLFLLFEADSLFGRALLLRSALPRVREGSRLDPGRRLLRASTAPAIRVMLSGRGFGVVRIRW
jgi:hypothetical protein